jgi:catechol 2,3-dioxygenase-like lactoylglutathione lyase family enzyme
MNIMAQTRTILGLHHVQITVPTAMEEAAVTFYTEVLGLLPVDKPEVLQERGGHWFQLGGLELHLSLEDGVNRRSTRAHVAYRVDDIEYWRRRMIENDITPVESIDIPGYDRFEARDPFGNRIEFIQRIG